MSYQPKVSIVLPVYNAERYLRECMDSIVNQTLRDIEVICVDDGSVDETLDILNGYAQKDSRVVVISQENRGAGLARNSGIRIASGRYIAFMDSDDYYPANDVLETLFYAAEENGANVCGGSLQVLREGKLEVGEISGIKYYFEKDGWVDYKELQQDYFYQRFIYCRELLVDNSILFPYYRRHQDPPFFLRAMLAAKKFFAVKKETYSYRVNATHQSWMAADKVFDMLEGIIDELQITRQAGLTLLHSRILRRLNWMHENVMTMSAVGGDPRTREKFKRIRSLIDPNMLRDWQSLRFLDSYAGTVPLSKALQSSECHISVVVAAYNVEEYIGTCLNSLVGQTLNEIEIICVNDGSSDGTLSVIEEYAKKDTRIRIIDKRQNEGLYLARKSGALQASGKYVVFADADDYFDVDACQQIYLLTQQHPVDIIHFRSGVEDYGESAGKSIWLEQALIPDDVKLSSHDIFKTFYINRNKHTVLWGKAFSRSLCETVYKDLEDFYVYVGEDVFQFFYFSFFANSYVGVNTKPLYWYRRGFGVTNSATMPLSKFESYCRMGDLCKKIERFLVNRSCLGEYQKYLEAMSIRLLEDCCRIYSRRLYREDVKKGARLLLEYWRDNPVANKVFSEMLGMDVQQLAAVADDIPRYVRQGRAYSNSGQKPLVSVIIPVYAPGEYLVECLDSVVNQSLKEIEIICVNDGSTDGSLAVLEEYQARDNRITVISKENGGQASARNAGMKYAQGEYVYFFGDDDVLRESAMEELYQYAKRMDLDVLFFNADSIFESEEVEKAFAHFKKYYHSKENFSKPRSGPQLLSDMVSNKEYRVHPSTYISRRNHLLQNDILFPDGVYHEDNLFTFKNIIQANLCARINKPYFVRRLRKNSGMTLAKRFIDVSGYLRCYIGIITFLSQKQYAFPSDVEASVWDIITSLGNDINHAFKSLTTEEKEKTKVLSRIEQHWFHFIQSSRIQVGEVANATGEESSTTVEKDLAVEYQLQYLRAIIERTRQEIFDISRSKSYRIGRFITFIPRKIRGGIRCYKEHGLSYTINRVLVHLHIKKDPFKK